MAEAIKRGEKLSVLAYKKIEEMILNGELKPGERLNEHRFSVKYGLSRGPVREACRALERDGLVVSSPGRGVVVRQVTPKELYEIYDLRALLTGFMCQLAAQKCNEGGAAKLKKLNEEMKSAIEANNSEEYYKTNLEFHELIAKLAENETAHKVYNRLVKETHAHRFAVLDPEITIKQHAYIIEAIENQDADEARKRGEEHVLAGKERWLKRINEDGDGTHS
ncbi:GntR family transcriptional regulator [Salinicola peritrichatus]|uniref:GntR family transcriptional regulator n=1 Tax=Salinicola peritrichatus TaxID=1267424 RepID=UPI0013A602B2|nr:GntR family transcriptional regulator [Salinicola peritrichatus]